MSNGDLDGDSYLVIWDKTLTKYINPISCVDPEVNYPEKPKSTTDFGRPDGKPDEDQIEKYLLWFFKNE